MERLEIISFDADLVTIVIFLEERFQSLWQFQIIHIRVVLERVADDCPGQGLEGEGSSSVHWRGQHWLKEHARGRILTVNDRVEILNKF